MKKERCLSKRKDTNFKANHNLRVSYSPDAADVCLSAKIRILKQITTYQRSVSDSDWMFV